MRIFLILAIFLLLALGIWNFAPLIIGIGVIALIYDLFHRYDGIN